MVRVTRADGQRRHFDERAPSWSRRYATRKSFRARLGVVGTALEEELATRPGARVLDFGGGTGVFSELAAAQAGQVVCLDRSEAMVRQGVARRGEIRALLGAAGFEEPRARVARVVGTELALGVGARFEIVLAIAVLEYLADPGGVVEHLATMLAPGGVMLATVPAPGSPLRLAQAAGRPLQAMLAASGRSGGDQSFVALRPRGDRVPWRSAAATAGLAVKAVQPVPLGPTGVRAFIHPTLLVRLEERGGA